MMNSCFFSPSHFAISFWDLGHLPSHVGNCTLYLALSVDIFKEFQLNPIFPGSVFVARFYYMWATKQWVARLTRVGNRWTIGSGEGGCESCQPENHQTWKEGKRRRRWWCMRTDIQLDDIRGNLFALLTKELKEYNLTLSPPSSSPHT